LNSENAMHGGWSLVPLTNVKVMALVIACQHSMILFEEVDQI